MIEIKPITHIDLTTLAELLAELSGLPTQWERMQANFQWISANPDYLLLGAYLDGRLVGSLMGIFCHDLVGDCRPFMVLENVIVAAAFQGRGIGKQLLTTVEQLASERNCYYLMFVSGSQRHTAHRFYQSLGYCLDEVQGFKKYLRAAGAPVLPDVR